MIVEERIYKIRTDQMDQYLGLVRDEGLAIQAPILGGLIGYFVTEIGPLSHVVILWRYNDLQDRAKRRARLAQNPQWQEFTTRLSCTIETMENRILLPTDFSPIK